jgi:hypothetical protein
MAQYLRKFHGGGICCFGENRSALYNAECLEAIFLAVLDSITLCFEHPENNK